MTSQLPGSNVLPTNTAALPSGISRVVQKWLPVVYPQDPSHSYGPRSPARVFVAVLFFVFVAAGVFIDTWVLIVAGVLAAILFLMG